MSMNIPPELKKVTPFVRRAEELDRDKTNPESRLVAYYCRQYAVHTGISLAQSPGAKQCLGSILGQLEEEKAAMSNFTRNESKFLCRKFADEIFDTADGQDRMGMATKNTAKTFYAAASFFEILEQFYEEGEESEEYQEEKKRCKYAKWKATEILKAIREGREPTSGGYGENVEEEEEVIVSPPELTNETPSDVSALTMPPMPPLAPSAVETVPEDDESMEEPDGATEEDYNEEGTEVGLGPPPSYPHDSLPPPDQVFVPDEDKNEPPINDRPPIVPPPVYYKPPVAKPPTPEKKKSTSFFGMSKKKTTSSSLSGGGNKVSKSALADAVELTSFALAALQDKDTELGATRLKQALEALGR